MLREHKCINGVRSTAQSWIACDGQGIAIARVCFACVKEKTKHIRPELMASYTQADVNEPIEAEP